MEDSSIVSTTDPDILITPLRVFYELIMSLDYVLGNPLRLIDLDASTSLSPA